MSFVMRSFKPFFIFICLFYLSFATGTLAQPSPFPQISALDATNHLNHEVTVTDQVVQVALRPTVWLLHLNQKAPDSPLVCVARGASTNNFPNFENYLGQHIEVTGLIREFRGRLELVLTSPNQIKVVGAAEAATKAAPFAPLTDVPALAITPPPVAAKPVAIEPPAVTAPAPAPVVVTPPPVAPAAPEPKPEPKVAAVVAEPVTAPPVIVPQVAVAPPVAKPVAAPAAPVPISEPKPIVKPAAPPAVTVATSVSKPVIKPVATAPHPITLATTTPPAAKAGDNAIRIQAWIITFLGILTALLSIGILIALKRNPANPRTTTSTGALVKSSDATPADSAAVQEWKQRALMAEAMAGKQVEILREKIIPELTEFAKQSLIQGLVAQRTALLETNLAAQQSLIELETRLNTLQAPLQDRIRAYEERIAELEKEVATQGDQVRELTRASLMLLRKKLEEEREHARLQTRFN